MPNTVAMIFFITHPEICLTEIIIYCVANDNQIKQQKTIRLGYNIIKLMTGDIFPRVQVKTL
ncbi:hypothetical protein GCM10009413_00680 [Tatumella punctata]